MANSLDYRKRSHLHVYRQGQGLDDAQVHVIEFMLDNVITHVLHLA